MNDAINCYINDHNADRCYVCPNGNSTFNSADPYDPRVCVINESRRKRIWKQNRMSSSEGLLKKKSMIVSKMVRQGACPEYLSQAGGPGDLQTAIQKNNNPPALGNVPCFNLGRLRNRTVYKNQNGVDRKHDSYDRYLARRVGGELRKEKMPNIKNKTAYIGQPRNRTGTKCHCRQKLTREKCGSTACCNNRIPSDPSDFTGCYGPKRTCVPSRCRCPNCP